MISLISIIFLIFIIILLFVGNGSDHISYHNCIGAWYDQTTKPYLITSFFLTENRFNHDSFLFEKGLTLRYVDLYVLMYLDFNTISNPFFINFIRTQNVKVPTYINEINHYRGY